MSEAVFLTANGEQVRLTVVRKEPSQVFGKDFVSGGSTDFFSKFKEGYWIEAKCTVSPSNIEQIMRDATKDVLGSSAIVMEEAYASRQVTCAWEGHPTMSEKDVLASLGKRIQQSEITRDSERAGRREDRRLLSFLGRDGLIVVKEGNEDKYWAKRKYTRVWELLAEKGFLHRIEKGRLFKTVTYSVTPKGELVISRKIGLDD